MTESMPDTKVSVRKEFGIDSDLMVPAYKERGENVPDVWAVSAFLTVNAQTLAVAIAGPRHRMETSVAEAAQLLLATCSFISRQWSRG